MMVLDREAARRIKGPATVDGIGPSGDWEDYWRDTYAEIRRAAAWAQEPNRAA
jgi:hypothetical protein